MWVLEWRAGLGGAKCPRHLLQENRDRQGLRRLTWAVVSLRETKLLGLVAGGVWVLDRRFSTLSMSCILELERELPGGWASLVPI